MNSKEHADILHLSCFGRSFFTRRLVLQSTPPRIDNTAVRVLKDKTEIGSAWKVIMESRRVEKPNETHPIGDAGTLSKMYTTWMHARLGEN